MQNHRNYEFLFCSPYICICFLVLPEHWSFSKLTQLLLFYLETYTHTPSAVCPFAYQWGSSEDLQLPFSPSPSVFIFRVNDWLIWGSHLSKKDMMGFIGELCFLEHHCLLSASLYTSWNPKHGLLGPSAPHLLSCSTYRALTFTEFPCAMDPLEFCAPEARRNPLCKWGQQGTAWTHILHVLCSTVPLNFTYKMEVQQWNY